MKKKRTPKNYYTLELFGSDVIDEPEMLNIFQHENIWGEGIYGIRQEVNCFNFFLTKKEAMEALKKVRNALKG